jgi:hypothetical protein
MCDYNDAHLDKSYCRTWNLKYDFYITSASLLANQTPNQKASWSEVVE